MEEKNPTTTGVLNVLIAGLGHIYLGSWGRGIATFVVIGIAGALVLPLIAAWSETNTPLAIFYLLFLGVLFIDGRQAAQKYNDGLLSRKCYHCAELIQDDARVCKHCGKNPDTPRE